MLIGRLICERCGKDCTSLYGFALMTRGTIRNRQTQEALTAAKKRFGKEEFVWCWECTAEIFGARPLPSEEPKTPETDEGKPDLPPPKQDRESGQDAALALGLAAAVDRANKKLKENSNVNTS